MNDILYGQNGALKPGIKKALIALAIVVAVAAFIHFRKSK